MPRLSLILAFLVLAGVDTAAGLLALRRIGPPDLPALPTAVAAHLLVAVLALLVAGFHPGLRDRPGRTTLGILAASICLLTPILGCLVAGWLLQALVGISALPATARLIRLGNPLSEGAPARAVPCPYREPLTAALAHGHLPLQRLAAARLSRLSDRRALGILKVLDGSQDARTHLYAQAALASAVERRERQLDRLRRALDAGPRGSVTTADCERLATALMQAAAGSPEEAPALLAEASEALDRALSVAPADASCLYLQALSLIRLGKPDRVPDLYGRLCAIGGGGTLADRLELAYLASLGNWKRASEAAERVLLDRATSPHFESSHRAFWLVPGPGRAPR